MYAPVLVAQSDAMLLFARSVCPTSAPDYRRCVRPNSVPVTPCTFALTDRNRWCKKNLQLWITT